MIYLNALTNSIRGMKCPTNLYRKRLPKEYEQLERLEQGFKPTGFPPTPVSSPKKGAPAFSSFQGQMAILERKLQELDGPPPTLTRLFSLQYLCQ
jgi:hypothetical protein